MPQGEAVGEGMRTGRHTWPGIWRCSLLWTGYPFITQGYVKVMVLILCYILLIHNPLRFPPLPLHRFGVYHPHQDRSGLPPAERCD
jgi:hypothetical protein